MITKRLLILQGIVLFGMGSIYLLPSAPKSQPVGINLQLPEQIGNWHGREEAVTEKEHNVLGPETEFSRKRYRNAAGDEIYASIVLGGQDMNTSIHLPERCLPAQGWTIMDKSVVPVALEDAAHPRLAVTRLHNMHPAKTTAGTPFTIYAVDYYWFVGYKDTTPSHWVRTYYDIRDRVLSGYNQRWAFVTVMAILDPEKRPDSEVDAVAQSFIRELVPIVHRDTVVHY